MKIKRVEVENFRILRNNDIMLHDDVTLIVGRNNSGKTSFAEIFSKFFGGRNTSFEFEDFSLSSHRKGETDLPNIDSALQHYHEYQQALSDKESEEALEEKRKAINKAMPKICLRLYLEYDPGDENSDGDDLASLQKFIMDLDIDRNDACISAEYSVDDHMKIFKDFGEFIGSLDHQDGVLVDFLDFIRPRHRQYYSVKYFAVDSKNQDSRIPVSKNEVQRVFQTAFIKAQRELDDHNLDNQKQLSRAFESYYTRRTDEDDNVKAIEDSLREFAGNLDEKYKELFDSIFSDLRGFGIGTGINLQEIKVKAQFEAAKILHGNTKLFYAHADDSLLPEAYNGLGFSNLIYIILQFITFYEDFSTSIPQPNFQLIFVEEPEAHFHPQMQQVFIRNIEEFVKKKTDWDVQIIISTHSSHIVSESGFECLRYFDISRGKLSVKNLLDFKNEQHARRSESLKFLRQYMQITNCDMFFADKVILVEGTVERLLLRSMIQKVTPDLLSEYLSVIEVGGAYASNFRELLEFIGVRTLIITDLDSVDPQSRKSCPVQGDAVSSNSTLINWIPNISGIKDLLDLPTAQKEDNNIRVAYQIPDSDKHKCGRSFEEAFILSNVNLIQDSSPQMKSYGRIFENHSSKSIMESSFDLAAKIKKKSDFAFDILAIDSWKVPKYLEEGLAWLAGK